MQVAEELSLDDRSEFPDHLQVAAIVALRKDNLVVLGAQVTFVHARRHVAHYVDLVNKKISLALISHAVSETKLILSPAHKIL